MPVAVEQCVNDDHIAYLAGAPSPPDALVS
jgi:hypothetical protein